MHDEIQTGTLAQKIPNQELRKLATEESDQVASVLIEVELPSQQVDFARAPDAPGSYRSMRIAPESSEQQTTNRQLVDAANEYLTSVLGTSPRWLRSARAFVASVTPEQLRQIVRSPLVKEVQPNRQLRLPRGA